MIPALLVIAVLWMLPTPWAGAADLMTVYRLALERDPQFAAAAASHDSSLEVVPQAKAGLLPTINASAGLNFNHQTITYGNPAGLGPSGTVVSGQPLNFPSHTFSINITQPVYHREAWIALRQSDERVRQANAEYGAARQDLMVRSAQGYFNVLAALDSLETAHAEKVAVGRQLDQSKQRFTVGIIAITDVQEAQASYDLAVAQEIAAENQVANTREALRAITGTDPGDTLAPLGEDVPLVVPDPTDAERWADIAVSQNLTLDATRAQAESARSQVEIQRSEYYPHVDAVGSVGMQDLSGGSAAGSTETDSAVIGLQVSVPLYQGGLTSSRVRQSEADYTRAHDLLEQQLRATVLSARKSYLGVIAGISRVKALKQAVISNQSALQATDAGYQVGTRTIVDVLNAQRLLFAAERDYAQARYDYVLNTLLLKQAAGQLSDVDLVAVNNWLGTGTPTARVQEHAH